MISTLLRPFLALALALGPAAAFAADKPTDPPKKAAAKKGEPKKPAGPEADPAAKAAAESLERSDKYVHRWIPMPAFKGPGLGAAPSEHVVEPKDGRLTVIVFLASWCEPCQQLMTDFRVLEKRYKRLGADFVYVFAHDTKDDAQGFMQEFGVEAAMLATHDVLRAFHNPELPTVYVGDKTKWLATRYVKAGKKELASLDDLLKHLTAM